jgi:PAT family beta-lactamase induction signal transducer AmpG
MPRLPNLLATRRGRLAAFFLLYTTEGVPLGFAAVAIATELRRRGVGPAEIGSFVASFYLPWAFKWAAGPFVDVFRSQRWGHRRGWILLTQVVMALTLAVLVFIPLPQGLALFTAILLVHNTFAAVQDVAIDSLAVNTLGEDERGLANGLMFSGAMIGQAVGGSGVLFASAYVPFQSTFLLVAASIALVTVFVALPMKEAVIGALVLPAGVTRMQAAMKDMRSFAVQSFQSFVGTSGAFRGVFFSLLPAGAMSLGLALQTNLAVELGMNDDQVGSLSFTTSLVSAACMVLGGWLSDKLGRRITLAWYLFMMSVPVLYLMWVLQQAGYVMPRPPGSPPIPALVTQLWIANVGYSVFQGLMYGTRSAIMMDVTNPRVAATQFTAYMAMMNLAIAFSASWQGVVIEAWGYPTTLLVDAVVGPLCILLLPAMKETMTYSDDRANWRSRTTAAVLGACAISFVFFWPNRSALGAVESIAGTFYTLVFVASALFLLAGREVLGASAGVWGRAALWISLPLLAMYGRYWVDKLGGGPLAAAANVLLYAAPLAGGAVLLAMSRMDWSGATKIEGDPALERVEPEPAG